MNNKGFSVYEFTVSSSPSGGSCYVTPSHGISLKTVFLLACDNWNDTHQPITYEFLAKFPGGFSSILSFGYTSNVSLTLPTGDPGANHTLNITVLITNYAGVSTQKELSVQVGIRHEIQRHAKLMVKWKILKQFYVFVKKTFLKLEGWCLNCFNFKFRSRDIHV